MLDPSHRLGERERERERESFIRNNTKTIMFWTTAIENLLINDFFIVQMGLRKTKRIVACHSNQPLFECPCTALAGTVITNAENHASKS